MKLAIRGYVRGELRFEERVDVGEGEMEELGRRHVEALMGEGPHMIEVEFLEEADPGQRFFRFGTDPGKMVQPVKVAWRAN